MNPSCKWSIVSIQILGHGRLSMIMVKPAILRAFTGQHGHPNLWEPIGPSNNQCSWNRTIVLYSILAKVVLEGHFVWFYFSIFCVFCWNLHAVQSYNYSGTMCLTNTETPKFHTSIQYSTLAVHLFSRHFSRLITITWMQRGSRKWYSSALFLNVTAKSLIINGGHQMLLKNISISTMIDWLLERETVFFTGVQQNLISAFCVMESLLE